MEGWTVMGQPEHLGGRSLSKFLLMVVPGVAASAVAVFVLYAVSSSRVPDAVTQITGLTPQGDGLSTEERRELTRQMMKARRESPQEEPALVRPTPRLATTGVAEEPDARARADRAPAPASAAIATAPTPPARAPAARAQPAPAATAAVGPPSAPAAPPTLPPGTMPSGAAPAGEATVLPPVVVNTNPQVATANTVPPAAVSSEARPRGLAANVFSSISVFAGTAANATGNTVNWVIELPGRAISAGGRLFGGSDSAGNAPPPATGPPPPAAPAPKRNYL